jgi:hypothetical protein
MMRAWIGIILGLALLGGIFGQQRAAAGASDACMVDVVLVIDHASSLSPEALGHMSAFAGALAGALPMGTARLGVVGFARTGEVRLGLSGDGGAVGGAVAGLGIAQDAADFREGLSTGYALLDAEARPNAARALVLITDGFSATDTRSLVGRVRPSAPTGLITVGVGAGVSRRELYNLSAPMRYSYNFETPYALFAARSGDLPALAGQVASALCGLVPTIEGRVNARLPRDARGVRQIVAAQNALVSLLNEAGGVIASTRTDANGRYLFYVMPGVLYHVRVEPVPGYPFAPGYDGLIPNQSRGLAQRGTGRSSTLLEAPG